MLTPGCTMGPRTVTRDRFNYSAAGADSWKSQMLLNLVRRRYPALVEKRDMQDPYRTFGGVTDPFARRDAWAVGLSILATLLVSHLLRLLDSATVGRDVLTIVALTYGDLPWSDMLLRLMATVLGLGLAWGSCTRSCRSACRSGGRHEGRVRILHLGTRRRLFVRPPPGPPARGKHGHGSGPRLDP